MNRHWPWIKKNRARLERHAGQYVAVVDEEIFAHAPKAGDVIDAARASGRPFWILCVPTSWRRVRIYPIRVRSLRRSSWEPLYPVTLQPGTAEATAVDMLVDSGADVSCISLSLGEGLGLVRTPQESVERADGLGGSVRYVGRDVSMDIDGHMLTVPVAWVQDDIDIEPILGREVVFDCFDVLMQQRDERLTMTWRGPPRDDGGAK